MIGAACALATALCWAGASTITKFLTVKIDTLSLSALRMGFVSLCLLGFVFLSGRATDLVHTPSLSLIYVIASGVIGLVMGDTIYIRSLGLIDVSKAYPIAMCSFPVFTMIVAISLLGEPFTWINGLGALIVLLGLYLLTTRRKQPESSPAPRGTSRLGLLFALIAAALWMIAAVFLKKGTIGMDPFLAASIRIPSAAIVLFSLALTQRKKGVLHLKQYGCRPITLAATAGVLSYGVAGVLYIVAIQLLGAGKAVLLTAVSPLFILPLSVFILKEKLTLRALMGVLICAPGVYLVAI